MKIIGSFFKPLFFMIWRFDRRPTFLSIRWRLFANFHFIIYQMLFLNLHFLFLLFHFVFSRNCTEYWPEHYTCDVESNCKINKTVKAHCQVSSNFDCDGDKSMEREVPCIYCWQLPETHLRCYFKDKCVPAQRPQPGTCSTLPNVECLGTRTFGMQQYCKTTSGYSLTITVFLSLFFGGIGADRFYLGYIAVGFLKLFSLGGFGIWSLIDLILLIAGVTRPKDGSLFKEFNA